MLAPFIPAFNRSQEWRPSHLLLHDRRAVGQAGADGVHARTAVARPQLLHQLIQHVDCKQEGAWQGTIGAGPAGQAVEGG